MSAAAVIARRRRAAGQSRLFDPSRRRLGARSAPEVPASGPGTTRLTLEQKLTGVWEGLVAAGSAACPLCGAEMRREPGRAEGRCGGCGSALS
ncbi:MAG: hypothetical protein WD844_15220 [Thermoleophilaceae bacterium]